MTPRVKAFFDDATNTFGAVTRVRGSAEARSSMT